MLQRHSAATHCLWCFLVLSAGPTWYHVKSDAALALPRIPPIIEQQAKFFQDFFSVQLSPYKIEFGHVCEDPNTWEQRYEKKDFQNHRDMGKVRWGDKKGGYGEHYWDLNHAGHTSNQGSDDYDDGSYHENPQKTYDDSGLMTRPNIYESEQYNAEEVPHYDEIERNKRAHTRDKTQQQQDDEHYVEKNKEIEKNGEDHMRNELKIKTQVNRQNEGQVDDVILNIQKPFITNNQRGNVREHYREDTHLPREKHNIVLVVNHKEREGGNKVRPFDQKLFVPYGAGVRQHFNAPVNAASSVPSLIIHPSTGHVVDKNTGQPLVLQPVHHYIRYS